MSYTRDRDWATRGVRAIASADNSPTRQAQRLRMAQATRARDRAMASITRGALGLVTSDSSGEGGGGGGGVPKVGPIRPTVGFVPGATYSAITTNVDLAPKPPPPYTMSPGAGGDTIGPAPHPQPTDPVRPPPRVSPPSGGGGGGGTGVAMGPAAPLPPIPSLPPVDVSEPAEPQGSNTMRNALIAGGAALAAYLLFVRGRNA